MINKYKDDGDENEKEDEENKPHNSLKFSSITISFLEISKWRNSLVI